ncbi:MAG: hypothetical protein MZV64_66790 [Ignavibacteriales bacterium]|nr:hypothetical protein [Ignavibacteriales bacterium]
MNKTYIAFGNAGREKKEMQAEQDANSMSLKSLKLWWKDQLQNLVSSIKTLTGIWLMQQKKASVKIEELKDEDLPDEMKKMTCSRKKSLCG